MVETPTGPFVIVAAFQVRAGAMDRFLELARMDSRESQAREPGCRQFDVCIDRADANRVVLYEVYDDEAAFDAHLGTPHLAAFRSAIDDLVSDRQVHRLTRLHG